MTVVSLGALTVGQAIPGVELAVSAGIAGVNGALPDITSRAAALAAFQPTPVSFAASLAVGQAAVASVQASIAAGLPVPSIDAQIALVGAQVAALRAQIAAVQVQLDQLVALQSPLLREGVTAWAYEGAGTSLGDELGTAVTVAHGTAQVRALLLVTTTPETWAALSAVVKAQ